MTSQYNKGQMTFCFVLFCFVFYNRVRYAVVFFSFIHNFCYYQWGLIGNRYVRVPFSKLTRLLTALFIPFLNAYLTFTPSRSTWLFRSVGSLTLRKRKRGCGQSTNWRSCQTYMYVSTMYNNITKKLFNTFLFFFLWCQERLEVWKRSKWPFEQSIRRLRSYAIFCKGFTKTRCIRTLSFVLRKAAGIF